MDVQAPDTFDFNTDLTPEETYEKLLEEMMNFKNGAEAAVEKFYPQ